MKPIAIFRHAPADGPGYLAEFLDSRGLAWRLIRLDAGEPVPDDPHAHAGLAFMGGPMSVNDPLPWIAPVLRLIRAAIAADIPVLGHCLGGQLMSRALGGRVAANPVQEIGWGRVAVAPGPLARHWFGDIDAFDSFHWHGETFTLPEGSQHLLSSAHCANQAFALGRHLGLQCHVEMTGTMIEDWCAGGADEIAATMGPAVQTPEQIRASTPARLPVLRQVAERLYSRWIEGLKA